MVLVKTMNKENILALFECLGVKNLQFGEEWVRGSCPLAFARHQKGTDKRPSFGVKIDDAGESICNCFSCNTRGNLNTLLTELLFESKKGKAPKMNLAGAFRLVEDENERGYLVQQDWTYGKAAQDHFRAFPEGWLESFPWASASKRATAFLKARGVPLKLANELEIRYDTDRDRVCFPFRAHGGALAGMRGRMIDPPNDDMRYHDYRYQKHSNVGLVWLGEHVIDYAKPVVVVEGPFDYTSVYAVYPNVLANLSTGLNHNKAIKLAPAVEVLCFFDNPLIDMAGKLAYEKLCHHIGKETVVRQIQYPDNKLKDPGEIDRATMHGILADYVNL